MQDKLNAAPSVVKTLWKAVKEFWKLQSSGKTKSVFISTSQEMYRNLAIGHSYFAQAHKGAGLCK